MKVINRKSTIEVVKEHDNRDFANTQAAINSDGCLTLRSYYTSDKNNDTMLILSKIETDAVIRLFRELKNRDMLPF